MFECDPVAALEMGRRIFEAGLKAAPMDERSRALAATRFEEACMWAERGLLLAGPEPAGDS